MPAAPHSAPWSLPLQAADTLSSLPGAGGRAGLWRYGAAIPVDAAGAAELSMGEGGTPLLPAGRGALAGVHLKLEFLSPTGSFKDRGAVVLVASLRERGARELIADSSGNAGSAIAAYAARAALPCRVFVPAATAAAKRRQIQAYGAVLDVVAGDRTATAERAMAAVAAGPASYASHVHDPYFLQGTKTFAFELWEQFAGVPDAIVLPVGNGTLLLGAAIGFAELRSAGLIDRAPALVAVQSQGCAPLAQAWAGGAREPAHVAAQATVAEGIAIAHPARGAEVLAAVRDSGGCVTAVSEAEITAASRDLASRGLLVEPTAAVPWAAVLAARGRPRPGHTAPGADEPQRLLTGTVVVALCGSGLKASA